MGYIEPEIKEIHRLMYKDQDKQREANRAIQAKRRAKGVTGVTESGCDKKGVTALSEGSNSENRDDAQPVIPERTPGGHIRVSKPGDADYGPQSIGFPDVLKAYQPHGTMHIEEQPAKPSLSRTSSTKGASL